MTGSRLKEKPAVIWPIELPLGASLSSITRLCRADLMVWTWRPSEAMSVRREKARSGVAEEPLEARSIVRTASYLPSLRSLWADVALSAWSQLIAYVLLAESSVPFRPASKSASASDGMFWASDSTTTARRV